MKTRENWKQPISSISKPSWGGDLVDCNIEITLLNAILYSGYNISMLPT